MTKRLFANLDLGILIPTILLVALSLTTLYSINTTFFKSQLIFLIFSLFVFLVFSNSNYKLLQYYTVPIYVVSIVFLIIILIIGFESRGAVRWIEVFGISIQASEILKPFLVFCVASYLASRTPTFKTFVSTTLLLFPVAFLIYIQPDLGSAFIYVATVLLSLFVFGFPLWWFSVGFGLFIMSIPIAWNFLHDYQRQRLLTFINPSADPLGISYNVIQSMIAVGSGMFFGKGLNESTQSGLRFLPERHTDFIFATLSEGLGFVGSTMVIICFIFLLYRIYVIFLQTEEHFCKILAVFTFSLFFVQFITNVGMNVGLLPVVGVTLPFVSYGGSSLLSNFILLGLLSSVYGDSKKDKVLSIR